MSIRKDQTTLPVVKIVQKSPQELRKEIDTLGEYLRREKDEKILLELEIARLHDVIEKAMKACLIITPTRKIHAILAKAKE